MTERKSRVRLYEKAQLSVDPAILRDMTAIKRNGSERCRVLAAAALHVMLMRVVEQIRKRQDERSRTVHSADVLRVLCEYRELGPFVQSYVSMDRRSTSRA